MRLAAHLLQDLGFLLYAGPLLAFTVLVYLAPRVAGLPIHAAVRSYRAWGPGLGLALGACILGTLVGHWMDHGDFVWGLHSADAQQLALVHGIFVLAWISNIKLEVWTLEPLRKLDTNAPAPPQDTDAYASAARRLSRHMSLHSILILAVAILEISRRST